MSSTQVIEEQSGISSLKKAGFELKPTGLVIHGEPIIEDWIEAGIKLKLMNKTVQWWLGDWLNYGERIYGEMYSQALEATDYEYDTLRKFLWVAREIEIGRRHPNLSWSHHRQVVPLESEKQDYWLKTAEAAGWTRYQFRIALREAGEIESKKTASETEDERITFLKDWLNCFWGSYSPNETFDSPFVMEGCQRCQKLKYCKEFSTTIEGLLALRRKILKK